ncbi:multidrug ABC transporter ATP-binding protein [Lottiidibacillus patelloidae]|uniref:Multidrug ABC transporter ATP-binding protein n=1 Tax=Lottiidibacillus patelloidae TaxID=2670334 RepID=A0A263BPZ1_9BACI|nr:ABC-F type ribosomal protection protein [Lottiidibacillus patelloidae]OZM55810.1 multidrug ABC transporter ATP-binding protein [Lottiidibacillus patelloidae]
MILLQVNQLTKNFGAEVILSNIKLEIKTNDRIALIGRNGAGKSTLLKIISGHLSYDSGEVIKPKHVSIGYLAQNTGLDSTRSIWDEMLKIFEHLQEMEKQLRNLEKRMGEESVLNDASKYEKVLAEYDELQLSFKEQGGYKYEADIRSVLHGMSFSDMNYETKISTLSGGQKTRLALAKLLLEKPDLLILDEPTNHLDIQTLSWLEKYLQAYPGALLIVSHDRYFLDKVVNTVYEISRRECTKFAGNYSFYLEQRHIMYEQQLKQYEKQQAEKAKLQEFVQKNIARASTTKRAQSKRKQLEKMEDIDRPLGDEKKASFSFDIEKQSGNDVLKVQELAVRYQDGEPPVFKNVTFAINRSESVAIVGPNGIGKSTLLKTIIGTLQANAGTTTLGSNVTIGYYDQEQANLMSNKDVLHELWDEYPGKTEKEIRTVLGNFLFSGDDVFKAIKALSGGEKARVALAKLMLQNANLLIFDEPTNHLDLESKEILESALIDYPGTILFVSHDRYFINRLATRVIELSKNGAEDYIGDYDYYLEKKEELRQIEEEKKSSHEKATANTSDRNQFALDKEAKKRERQRLRRIEELEAEIESFEQKVEDVEQQLCDPIIFDNHEKVNELNEQLQSHQDSLMHLMEEWEALQDS